jgi:two-component system LytT family response regulator
LRNNKPDILFLDIVLDSGSGFDILEEIDHEDIRVVMCSAHDEFALKAIRYQVTDYLLKPLEIQDLISTVEKIEKRIAKYKKRQVYDSSHFTSFNNAMPILINVLLFRKNRVLILFPLMKFYVWKLTRVHTRQKSY